MAKRDYTHKYYDSRFNRLSLSGELPKPRVLSLSEFWKQNPIFNRGMDEGWKRAFSRPDNSYVSDRKIDLNPDPRPVPQRENKMPFKRSRYYDRKDYPER